MELILTTKNLALRHGSFASFAARESTNFATSENTTQPPVLKMRRSQENKVIMSASVLDIPINKISGEPTTLAEFKGHVLLVVNVASKCGLTPQYEGLEKVYEQYKGQGLVVAGFPANDFRAQEPGTNEEIQTFCTTNFGVKFPLFEKITVVGPEKHPLYKTLIEEQPKAVSLSEVPFREKLKGYGIEGNPEPEILWNFEKFLVSRNGKVVERFAPDTQPDAPELKAAIESELAKS
jgi:glutathione peroxidase